MVYVNIPEGEYKAIEPSKLLNGVQYFFVRFNAVTTDGIVHAVEHELNHEPSNEEILALQEEWLSKNKVWKKLYAEAYAKSNAVKGILVNGEQVEWFDSERRTSIRQAINDKRAEGRTTTTIYFSNGAYPMSLDDATSLLRTIELYASDCYEVTEQHKAAIDNLTTVSEIEQYDCSAFYPTMPSFTIPVAE